MNNEFALLEAQQEIHELIAQQAPLEKTLEAIASWTSIQLPGALAAFMRLDSTCCSLSMYPTQRFSQDYVEQVQEMPVSAEVASCGSAAYWRRLVITENIQSDPRWEGLRSAALAEGLRACWSSPVITAEGELLGVFGTYFRQPAAPDALSKRLLNQAAALTALAILKDRESRRHLMLVERHRSLFLNHPDGAYEIDLEGCFRRCNAALEQISGYSEQDLVGHHFNELVASDYCELNQATLEAARAGASRHYETLGIHADGSTYHLEVSHFPVAVEGEVVGVYGICRDITQRKRQAAELSLLERGMEASLNGITMSDAIQPGMPMIYVNEAFCHMTGYTRDEALGLNCRFLQGLETDPVVVDNIRHALATRSKVKVTLLNYRKDGTTFWNRLAISPVVDASGLCTHFIGIQQDITFERDQANLIAYQASHDLLTGLPNRTVLDELLEHEFWSSRQDQSLLVVAYLDLDGFKAINDGLGHDIGNRLLVAVADRLHPLLGPGDTLVRLNGDEFVFLMPELASCEEGINAAQRLLDVFEQSFEIDGCALHISASIGIAHRDETVGQARELIQHADLALAAAKRQGRNTWQWYTGKGTEGTSDQVLMRHDLHNALRDNQFELFYQPVVEAASGRIKSIEALIRWHHPTRGLISPGIFIPIAEQTGQIIPLGRWVLREACQRLANLFERGERVFPVAVNISTLQFRRDGFLDEVAAILEETRLPPALLELEMTESILLDGAEQAIEMIGTLRDMGITVTIDDFGTGFSSLSYLRDLPIHKIKLDRAFIKDILTSHSHAALVQGIITMAHHMDLVVVAEGIEDIDQQNDLVRRECDLLQGFLFSRPVPLDELMLLPNRLTANDN
ncbi:MAG: EAL domain-containing protein [Halomonas sp.]|nr:EAL domain-containing protein [Halomonas sp.]